MKRWMIAAFTSVLLAGTAAGAHAESGDAAAEKRLADAQRRLEDAAREVAELPPRSRARRRSANSSTSSRDRGARFSA